jgi:hypothetical protein
MMTQPGRRASVEIDKEIAPLIKATWALGIETFASCQDFQATGDIQVVMSHDDLRLFLTVVARNAERAVAQAAASAGIGPWRLHVWSAPWERGKAHHD